MSEWFNPDICQPLNGAICKVLGNPTLCCEEDMEEEQICRCIFVRKISEWKPDMSWYKFSEIFYVDEDEPKKHMEIVKKWMPLPEPPQ